MNRKRYLKRTYLRIDRQSHDLVVKIRRSTWKTWLAAVLSVAAISIAIYWYTRPEPPVAELPVVGVEKVGTQDVEIYGDYVGRIRAQQFVEIRARVEGYLEKMLFEEGTYVKKGQVLFIIDPKQYKAKVDKSKAQLNKNKALALKAQRDLERIRPLFAPSSTPFSPSTTVFT